MYEFKTMQNWGYYGRSGRNEINKLKLQSEGFRVNVRKHLRPVNVIKMGSLQSLSPRALNKCGFRYNPVLAQ